MGSISWSKIATYAGLVLFLFTAFCLGLPFWPAVLGAGSWIIAVILKVGLGPLFKIDTTRPLGGGLWGLWSCISELGLAAVIFLWLKYQTIFEALSFGLGAGLLEYTLIAGSIAFRQQIEGVSKLVHELESNDSMTNYEAKTTNIESEDYWHTLYERIFATLGHVASRTLVWLCLLQGVWLAGFTAVITFSLVDGTVCILQGRNYDFEDSAKLYKFLHFNAFVSSFECMVLSVLVHFGGST